MGIRKIVDFVKYFPSSQNRRFGEIFSYFLDYSAIRIFTPALVLVIGGAEEIYGVALL